MVAAATSSARWCRAWCCLAPSPLRCCPTWWRLATRWTCRERTQTGERRAQGARASPRCSALQASPSRCAGIMSQHWAPPEQPRDAVAAPTYTCAPPPPASTAAAAAAAAPGHMPRPLGAVRRKLLRVINYLIQLACGDGSAGTPVPFSPLIGGAAAAAPTRRSSARRAAAQHPAPARAAQTGLHSCPAICLPAQAPPSA